MSNPFKPKNETEEQQNQAVASGNPFKPLSGGQQPAQPTATPGAATPASEAKTPSLADQAAQKRAAAQAARQALGQETTARNPFGRKMTGGKARAEGTEEHAQRQEQIAQAESEKKNYLWDYLKTTLGGMSFQPGGGVQMDEEAAKQSAEKALQLRDAAQRERELRTHTEDWEGRSELLRKVEELEDAAAWATTPEQADAIEAQLKQTREQLARGDIAAGNGSRTYGTGDLGRRFGKGTALDIGASIGSAISTAGKQMQSSIMAAQPGAPVTYEGLDARSGGALTDQWAQMDAVVDRMSENSRREFETIKNGHGAAYGAAVDVAQNMVQMGFDAAISGGHALIPMFVRTFGSSAQEARKAGASVSQQALYGVAKGTVEVLTEKIGGLGSRAYGKGWTDALTDRLVSRLASSEIGMNLVRVLMGATEEGLEEVMSDLMDPLAKQLAGMDWEGYDLDEILYDYLIGATVGGLSGSGTAVSGGYAQENAEARQGRDARDEARAWEQATGQRLSGAERRELERFIRERGQTGNPALGTVNGLQARQEAEQRAGAAQENRAPEPTPEELTQRRMNDMMDDEESMPPQSPQNGPETAQAQRDKSVPPSTQDPTTGETERLNQGEEAESPAQTEQKTQPTVTEEAVERIKAQQNPESGLREQAQDGVRHTDRSGPDLGGSAGSRGGSGRAGGSEGAGGVAAESQGGQQARNAGTDAQADPQGSERGSTSAELKPENHGEFHEDDTIPEDKPSERSNWNSRRDSTPSEEEFQEQERRLAEAEEAQSEPENPEEAYVEAARKEYREHHLEWEYEARRKNGELTDEEKQAAKESRRADLGEQTHDHTQTKAEGIGKTLGTMRSRAEARSTEDGKPLRDVELGQAMSDAVEGWVNGTTTARELADAYRNMAEGGEATDGAYFHSDRAQDELDRLAEAEEALTKAPDSEEAQKAYRKAARDAMNMLEARLGALEAAQKLNIDLDHESVLQQRAGATGVRGVVQNAAAWYSRMLGRPDIFFHFMGGFDKPNSKAWYKLADYAERGTIDKINIRQEAMEHFTEVTEMKGYKDFETGKTRGKVEIPGLGRLTMNYELGLLRLLETGGAIEHIARHGARFAAERDYYAGRNNNGFGDNDNIAREMDLGAMADRFVVRGKDGKASKDAWLQARRDALLDLTKQLKAEVMADPVAAAAYRASVASMAGLAAHLNRVSKKLYGIKMAMGGETYWPMEVCGKNKQHQTRSAEYYDLLDARFMHRREGPRGALRVRAFTDVTNRYIEQASNYAAWGEMSDRLEALDKNRAGEGPKTLGSLVTAIGGKNAEQWLHNWEDTINGKPRGEQNWGNKVIGKIRSNMANAALNLNPGVALKQTPSFFDYAGELDPRALARVWFQPRTTKSMQSDPLIQELNRRTGVLKSRASGFGMIEVGDAMHNTRGLVGKVTGLLPPWITKMDYRTVAKGALAAMEQIKMENPGIDTDSDEFYRKAAELFERATIRTNPIYDAQFRPEAARTENEILRSLNMFRTQQNQNLNQLVNAIGEYMAAKGTDWEAEAQRKLNQTVGGQLAGHVMFSLLGIAADMLMHRKDDYEDENGKLSAGAIAGKFNEKLFGSMAGTLWLCDTAAEYVSAGIAKATGKNADFYGLSDNVLKTISDAGDALLNMIGAFGKGKTGAQKVKAVKNAIVKLGQLSGIPIGNAYNMANSLVMYALDAFDANPDSYDEIFTMLADYSGRSEATKAKRTSEAAMASLAEGDTEKAEALLASLNWESNSTLSAFQSAVKAAVTSGQLSQEQGDKLLHEYGATKEDQIVNLLLEASQAKAYNEAKEKDKTTFEAVEAEVKAEEDKVRRDGDRAKLYAVMDILLNGGKTPEQVDVMVPQNSGKKFTADYEAMRQAGQSPEQALRFLEATDGDGSGEASQEEVYTYFLQHPEDEERVKTLWDARGYADDWETYKAAHAKNRAYDELALEKGEALDEAAEALKDLKSDASYYQQTGASDREIMRRVLELGYSDEDTDTVMSRYLSADGYKNWKAVRAIGKSPAETMNILMRIDADRNGSVTTEEAYIYYSLNQGSDALMKAIWNAGDHKDTWEGYKVSQVKGQSGKMDQVLSYGYSAAKTDEMMAQYLSKGMASSYSIARDNGLSPKEAVRVLQAIDANGNGTLSQAEMKAYYRANPGTEAIIAAIWASQDNKTSWETAKNKR